MTDVINGRKRGRPLAFDRDDALARAMEVFWAAGYEGASIPLLTQAMGISAQSLYAAFTSKDALYREAIERYRNTAGGFGTRALEAEADALDAVARLLHDAAITFSQNPATPGCMITMAPAGTADEPLVRFGRALRAEATRQVAERLARGVDSGQVRADTDCAAWAHYVAGVVQGLSVQARDAIPAPVLMETARIAARALDAIRADKPGRGRGGARG